VVLLCQCSINSQQDQTCPFLVKKEYLVPFWVRRPKENQEKKKKKKSGKIEWCRLVLFVQKKRLQQSAVFCRKYVVVCSFYLSFSVLTENPDAQNGHNNQSVQSKLCYYPICTRLPLFLGSPFLAVYLANEWVFLRLSILQKYFSFYSCTTVESGNSKLGFVTNFNYL
jgi:hypothetical protein